MAASAAAVSRKRTGLHSAADSDETSVHSLSSEDWSDDDFQLVRSRKAKRRNTGSPFSSGKSTLKSTRKTAVSTIIFVPELATDNLRQLNRQSVSVLLEAAVPNEVRDVRVNTRKNVLAVDVAHETALSTLSKITELDGIKVRSYIPLASGTTTGVIYDVDVSVSSTDLPSLVKPTVDGIPIIHMSRMGTSRCIKLTFKGESLPSHVKVGHFRHPVRPFIPRPLQCRKCMRFGHVSAVCQSTIICSRCAEPHAADSCDATVLKCRNCLGSHDASSNECPKKQKENEILKQMVRDRSSRREAVAVVRKRRSRRRRGSRNSVKRSSQVTPHPLLPRLDTPESTSEDKTAPEHMDTEAWPPLPKLHPESQPEPQPEPQPQPKPQHHTQRLQWSQQTQTESTTALVPHDLPEKDKDIAAMLRSLLNTIFMLLNKLNTPTARAALQMLEVLDPVFSALQ